LAIFCNFVTAPYAVPGISPVKLFFDNGLFRSVDNVSLAKRHPHALHGNVLRLRPVLLGPCTRNGFPACTLGARPAHSRLTLRDSSPSPKIHPGIAGCRCRPLRTPVSRRSLGPNEFRPSRLCFSPDERLIPGWHADGNSLLESKHTRQVFRSARELVARRITFLL